MARRRMTRNALNVNEERLFKSYSSLIYLFICEKKSGEYFIVAGVDENKKSAKQDFIALKNEILTVYDDELMEEQIVHVVPELTDEVVECSLTNPAIRPAQSIGNPITGGTGTLGAIINLFGHIILVSCNHVLQGNYTPPGTDVIMPGKLDGGDSPQNNVAKFIGGDITYNRDSACAEKTDDSTSSFNYESNCGYTIKFDDKFQPKIGDKIKYCRKGENSLTDGPICGINCIVLCSLTENGRTTVFKLYDQIVSERISSLGDSGSIAIDAKTNSAVGLVFAHTRRRTFVNNIAPVFYATVLAVLKYYGYPKPFNDGFSDEALEIFKSHEELHQLSDKQSELILKEIARNLIFL